MEARIKKGLRKLPSREHPQTSRNTDSTVATFINSTRWHHDGCEALLHTVVGDHGCKDMQDRVLEMLGLVCPYWNMSTSLLVDLQSSPQDST